MGPYLEAGEAEISAAGIRYLGRAYTLSLAVKQQWYMHAYANGPWKIEMYCDIQPLRLFLKFKDAYYSCEPVTEIERNDESIHNEMRIFSQLKERWLKERSGNKSVHHFPGKRSNR